MICCLNFTTLLSIVECELRNLTSFDIKVFQELFCTCMHIQSMLLYALHTFLCGMNCACVCKCAQLRGNSGCN